MFTTLTQVISVPKAGGIFNIEATGVAVGMRSTGTREQPLFQVAYPAELASISKLNGRDYDTGWVDLAPYLTGSGFSSKTARARRIGDIVQIYINVNLSTSLNTSTWKEVATNIPQIFRPQETAQIPGNGQKPGAWFAVYANGTISLRNQTGAQVTSGYWAHTVTTYFVG